jgi:hypothetical protein
MNAVVKKELPVLDEVGVAISEAVLFAGGDVYDLVGADAAVLVAADLQQLTVNANSAHEQATKIVVASNDQLALAGDLLKAINAQIKKVETSRKSRTDKINAFKASFMNLFSAPDTKLAEAKALVNDKMNAWGRAEKARLQEEENRRRKESEERALALAAAQQAMGDTKGADQIMTEAVKVIESAPDAKVVVRGDWGSTTSSRKVYSGEVTDIRAFLTWLLAQEKGDISNVVDFKKSGLNAIAKSFEGKDVPGFKNTTSDNFGSR